ncbi:MAG: T9SS type A sorting domain-containing protein [Muribaculaceae bacterium]|nr:T9SS type A sorting domain-containing protein [Muribaculaceae bacterium]
MNLLKSVTLSLAMLAGSSYGYAASTIRVTNTDGTCLDIEVADNMNGCVMSLTKPENHCQLVISNGTVVGTDEDGNPTVLFPEDGQIFFQAPVVNIDNIEFPENGAAVEDIIPSKLCVNVENGILIFTNVEKPVNLTVSNMAGYNVLNQTISHDTTINLSVYDAGIYVVTAGSQTFKILVR